jgi:hypothetical protein
MGSAMSAATGVSPIQFERYLPLFKEAGICVRLHRGFASAKAANALTVTSARSMSKGARSTSCAGVSCANSSAGMPGYFARSAGISAVSVPMR